MNEDSLDGSPILKTGNANHFRGMLAVNGRLTLTGSHLTFRANRLNLQVYEQSYPLKAVTAVEPRRGLALIGDGMAVLLQEGHEERFVVFGRGDWIREIAAAQDALAGSGAHA
ncbi:MAG: GRAM domain-containing protein [Gemmatimonadota bacterium]|nr:GRAM domain-containing protein [Gemmatimonadota bacterium]